MKSKQENTVTPIMSLKPFKLMVEGRSWGWVSVVHTLSNVQYPKYYFVEPNDKDWREGDQSLNEAIDKAEADARLWLSHNKDWKDQTDFSSYYEELESEGVEWTLN